MLRFIHVLVIGVYCVLPIAGFISTLYDLRRNRKRFAQFLMTAAMGLTLGVALALVYATAVAGRVSIPQALLAGYFAISLLLLLKIFDFGVRQSLRRLAGLHSSAAPRFFILRAAFVATVRVAIVAGVGLPLVFAAAMTYRPKAQSKDSPQSQMGFEYQSVEFRSTDGLKLAGWWIPTNETRQRNAQWRRCTVLVCHGLGASKSNQLILGRRLVPDGFNVLAFDFRAHGESGGQLTTFGDLERRDVLGAVRWLRATHPEQCNKIFGVGASMGAVALIEAAADDSPEGRAIEAIAAYAAYDSLPSLARTVSRDYFIQPVSWLALNIGMPMASVQTGRNLSHFRPADDIPALWPRPILFIHGRRDRIITFEHGQSLYDHAVQPKYYLWLPEGDHNDIVESDGAARVVLEFFKTARPLPVI
jgi:fermentation-respiration switch protein FrsA (DUF1100 family)